MGIYGEGIYSESSGALLTEPGGYIQIEPGWQLVAIPVRYGYWNIITHDLVHDGSTEAKIKEYIIDQIEDVMGSSASNYIEICNTLIGAQGNYWNFVPNFTNPSSLHNFNLAYYDSGAGSVEYTGFYIKNIHNTNITIKWGEPA
jgi:hypothetical protein